MSSYSKKNGSRKFLRSSIIIIRGEEMDLLGMIEELAPADNQEELKVRTSRNQIRIRVLKFRIEFLDENIEILEKYVLSDPTKNPKIRKSQSAKIRSLKLRRKQRQSYLNKLLKEEC